MTAAARPRGSAGGCTRNARCQELHKKLKNQPRYIPVERARTRRPTAVRTHGVTGYRVTAPPRAARRPTITDPPRGRHRVHDATRGNETQRVYATPGLPSGWRGARARGLRGCASARRGACAIAPQSRAGRRGRPVRPAARPPALPARGSRAGPVDTSVLAPHPRLRPRRPPRRASVSAHVAWITDHARTCYFNLDIDVEHDRKEGMVEGRTRVDLIDPRSV